MNKYIGAKLIKAEPAFRVDGAIHPISDKEILEDLENVHVEDGYKVVYQDGYVSWSPKDVFERAYLKVQDNPELSSGVSIGPKMVNEFISYTETKTIGEKTTLVRCVLRNGFEIIETSGCVDAKNYDETMGEEICMRKIKDKIWFLLGFLLQTAWHGMQ